MKQLLTITLALIVLIPLSIYTIKTVVYKQIRKDCIVMHKVQREMHNWQNEDCLKVGISVNLPIIEK